MGSFQLVPLIDSQKGDNIGCESSRLKIFQLFRGRIDTGELSMCA